jgi:transglutaminase-like putative cysteine protease
VAKSREGDCTEHAVLLAAMCRARKIPARVAIGLVYILHNEKNVPSPKFDFHMWTEAWIDGRWIPLDGTVGRGGISASYLKVFQSDLQGDIYSCILPVAQVAGKLKVEVLEAE